MSRRRISAVVTALALAGAVPLLMPANEASAASCSSYHAWSADANYNTGDIAARIVAAPMEIPVGVLTALCGGPFFLWLMRRDARRNTDRGGA